MPQTDLYLIQGNAFSDIVNFCCRLTEKAYLLGHRVHILTEESYQNEAINEALWSFKEQSFIPHAVIDEGNNEVSGDGDHGASNSYRVTIGALGSHFIAPHTQRNKTLEKDKGLLVCLGTQLPKQHDKHNRVSIIVPNNTEAIESARTTYRQLKTAKVHVTIHDLRL